MHSNWKVTMQSKYCAIQLPLLVDLRNWKWQQSRFCFISSTLIQFQCGPAPFGSYYLFRKGGAFMSCSWGCTPDGCRSALLGGGNNESQNGECGYEKWKFRAANGEFPLRTTSPTSERTLLRTRNIRLRISWFVGSENLVGVGVLQVFPDWIVLFSVLLT